MGSYTQFAFDKALADDLNIMISVIIPVYNSEKYLRECLDSIVNQSLINIEIICINDGSTDSSLDILNEYAIKDRRIKVISQINNGVSSARNTGIKIAQGEYIGFVDSDDYVDLDYFEKLYYAAKCSCADIAACSVLRIKNKKKKFLIRCKKEVITSDIKQKYKLLKLPNWSFSCCKIYKTQCLRESGVLFREGVFYEDIVFINTLVHKLKTLVTVPEIKYYYRIHADSITNQNSLKHIEDSQKAAVEIQEFVQTQGTLTGVGKHWYSEKIYELKILGLPIYTKVKYGRIIQHKFLSIPVLETKIFNEKIDLVYCWVDGNDKDWQNNKSVWSEKCGIKINPCRYTDNQELKYSLRALFQNASWINKIYIITETKPPSFLNINHPKIMIIKPQDIIPSEYLPCFNSELLESFIDEIPELSEYFLYANDDMFIGRPITQDYFFNYKGEPRVFLKRQKWKRLDNCYQKNIIFSANLIKKKYNADYTQFEPHHNIDAYRKSYIKMCKKTFSNEFQAICKCRFRKENSVQRHIYSLYMLVNNLCELKILKRKLFQKHSLLISTYYPIDYIKRVLDKYKPYLFCINDVENGSEKNRADLKLLLNDLYPNPAEWEK